jgi:hypothetical protein
MIAASVVLLALIAAVCLGTVWWHRRAPAPRKVGWTEVMSEAETGGYGLISTEEMADRYRRDPQGLLLVDTRPPGEYRAGHIAGALNFPLTPNRWGRWRSRRVLAALLGPDKERLVVFY